MVKTDKNEGKKEPPKSILDQILIETFNDLDNGEVFEAETVSKFKELAKIGSLNNKVNVVSILMEGLDEDTQSGN